jgi:glutamate--cysteine ligase catalytic subunit
MDCMAFGMGMCCLQVTFQARDIDESRYMYDQLAVLAPIMLAITAATPIFKGRLSDRDARWDGIAQSVDDRTPAERGEMEESELQKHQDSEMAGQGTTRLHKSRYDSVSTYIYHCKGDQKCRRSFEKYNDIPCPVDESAKNNLLDAGIDENLAHHLAHLFTRDTLVLFECFIEDLFDEFSTDHFENIQSTNWQTCRWKPPPPRTSPEDPHIGWRTEFRSMETQLTDFENAAFTVFIALITRVLLAFDLALYVPLSKVDENMKRSQMRDAAEKSKFYFRKHVAPLDLSAETSSPLEVKGQPLSSNGLNCGINAGCLKPSEGINTDGEPCSGNGCDSYEEMTLNEIFNGKNDYYPGLIPLVYAYIDYIECDSETFSKLDKYLRFISKRAKGETITTASWMRNFVRSHPDYKQDSVISQEISHDLMIACDNIGKGTKSCPEILGRNVIEKIIPQDAYGTVLPGQLSYNERTSLVQKLMSRAHSLRKEESDNSNNFLSYGKTRSDSFV